ncbi:MAG: hypothetical protein FWD68_09130 [Alphaproteobacteria bacterium]|nr:hypothetical protein [Alphaproteobacteria bacterium]
MRMDGGEVTGSPVGRVRPRQREAVRPPPEGPLERASQLRKIVALGRGRLDVTPQAIALPLFFILVGAGMIYAGVSLGRLSVTAVILILVAGALVIVLSAWTILGPSEVRFSLSEEGVQVGNVALPWSSIRDFSVTEQRWFGMTTRTTVLLRHVDGFVPPKLGLFFLFGRRSKRRRSTRYETRLMLHVGAKGMDSEKLAQRVGEFRAAAHAREEIARLQAG